MVQQGRLTSLVTVSPRSQAFEGLNLNLDLLDQRVESWKTELGLFDQPEFPPKNVKMSEGSIRFHDRSHILVQDYLGKSSYDLRAAFEETSLPPVFEELLTYFFSKVMHQSDINPEEKTSKEILRTDILLMRHLGYIDDSSIFIQDIVNISTEIDFFYRSLIDREDFSSFILTLKGSTRDCESWEQLTVLG
jgi:hypothetical protein